MFLKKFESSRERYFISYDNFNFNGYGVLKAFNSCGVKCIEKAFDNDGLFVLIKNLKIEADLYTSVRNKHISYSEIIKNVFRSIIEESLRGTIIPV